MTTAQPVQQDSRIRSLDILRGVAVLGILLMNIWSFAWPREVHDYPFLLADLPGATVETWAFVKVLFEDSQRTIFSMLFGAGALLLLGRLEAKDSGASPAKIYYRRTVLLIMFGLINGYIFLWPADILFVYGLCGLLLYPLHRWRLRSHLILAVCILLVPNVMSFLEYQDIAALKADAEAAMEAQIAGDVISEQGQAAIEAWSQELDDARPQFNEKIERDIRITSEGSYTEIFKKQAVSTLILQTVVTVRSFFWDALGAMLLGMVLYRSGFLVLDLPKRIYLLTLMIGYGIGLPVSYWEAMAALSSDFEPVAVAATTLTFDIGRIAMALGHMSLVMLFCQAAMGELVKRALAATGQMAFTNYLSQSILGALIFYGIGLGYYGRVPGFYMYGVVALIWALQITWSVLWMKRFRFGPFEWLWRSLIYGRLQPMSGRTSTQTP